MAFRSATSRQIPSLRILFTHKVTELTPLSHRLSPLLTPVATHTNQSQTKPSSTPAKDVSSTSQNSHVSSTPISALVRHPKQPVEYDSLIKQPLSPDFKMPYPMDFTVDKSTLRWKIGNVAVSGVIGAFVKVWTKYFNTFTYHNQEEIINAIDKREHGRGILTLANHKSCVDDPGIFSCLPKRNYFLSRLRWGMGANEILYDNGAFFAWFFTHGKAVPVVRGAGVFQPCMDFAIRQLDHGQWLNMFPEGKVNMNNEIMRLKWGVGRIISECKVTPIVIPIWHLGMDEILPTASPDKTQPWNIGRNKNVTVMFGKRIDFTAQLAEFRRLNLHPMKQWQLITERVQLEFLILRTKCLLQHVINFPSQALTEMVGKLGPQQQVAEVGQGVHEPLLLQVIWLLDEFLGKLKQMGNDIRRNWQSDSPKLADLLRKLDLDVQHIESEKKSVLQHGRGLFEKKTIELKSRLLHSVEDAEAWFRKANAHIAPFLNNISNNLPIIL